jgi:NADH dehydrogenase
VILRPNIIHGELDRYLDRLGEFCYNFQWMPVIDGGEAKCQPLFVHDFANAVLNAMTYSKAAGNTYELAGPKAYTHREIAEFIIEYCRFPARRRHFIASIPLPIAKLIGRVVNNIPWQRWRYLTPDIAIRMSMDNLPRGNALQITDLGITPQTLEDTAINALNIFRAEYTDLHSMDSMSETGRGI